jgi:type I restriction enzyme M protein
MNIGLVFDLFFRHIGWNTNIANAFLSIVTLSKSNYPLFMEIAGLSRVKLKDTLIDAIISQEKGEPDYIDCLRSTPDDNIKYIMNEIYQIKDFSVFVDDLLEYYTKHVRRNELSYNSPSIVNLVTALSGDIENKKIYAPSAGIGNLIWPLKAGNIELSEFNKELLEFGKKLLFIKEINATYHLSDDLFLMDQRSKMADLVIFGLSEYYSFTPDDYELNTLNYRFDNFRIRRSSIDALRIQLGLFHCNEVGKTIIVSYNGFLFRHGYDYDVRKYIIDMGFLETVIGLPSRLLPFTAMPCAILILNKNKNKTGFVNFIDATELGSKSQTRLTKILSDDEIQLISNLALGSIHDEKISKRVSITEIRDADYNLNVRRFFPEEEFVFPSVVEETQKLEQALQRFLDLQKLLLTSLNP